MFGTKCGTLCIKVLNNEDNKYMQLNIPAIIVPGFRYNLLSVKMLSTKGFDVNFCSGGQLATNSNLKLSIKFSG